MTIRIKITSREAGPIPSEALVAIRTVEGVEEVVVHASQATADSVEAGFIGADGDRVLVELPRETVSGRWRVWVDKAAIMHDYLMKELADAPSKYSRSRKWRELSYRSGLDMNSSIFNILDSSFSSSAIASS